MACFDTEYELAKDAFSYDQKMALPNAVLLIEF